MLLIVNNLNLVIFSYNTLWFVFASKRTIFNCLYNDAESLSTEDYIASRIALGDKME